MLSLIRSRRQTLIRWAERVFVEHIGGDDHAIDVSVPRWVCVEDRQVARGELLDNAYVNVAEKLQLSVQVIRGRAGAHQERRLWFGELPPRNSGQRSADDGDPGQRCPGRNPSCRVQAEVRPLSLPRRSRP